MNKKTNVYYKKSHNCKKLIKQKSSIKHKFTKATLEVI